MCCSGRQRGNTPEQPVSIDGLGSPGKPQGAEGARRGRESFSRSGKRRPGSAYRVEENRGDVVRDENDSRPRHLVTPSLCHLVTPLLPQLSAGAGATSFPSAVSPADFHTLLKASPTCLTTMSRRRLWRTLREGLTVTGPV